MAVPGIDLGGESGVAAALARASALSDARATPLATLRDGTMGLFLIGMAPRFTAGADEPGFVVVFVSELWLREAAADTATLQLTVGGTPKGEPGGAEAVHKTFAAAEQRFDVVVPQESVDGAAAVLPWIILVPGLLLTTIPYCYEVEPDNRLESVANAHTAADLHVRPVS